MGGEGREKVRTTATSLLNVDYSNAVGGSASLFPASDENHRVSSVDNGQFLAKFNAGL